MVYYRSALCGVVDSLRIHCWIVFAECSVDEQDDRAEADGLEITTVPFQADREETVRLDIQMLQTETIEWKGMIRLSL